MRRVEYVPRSVSAERSIEVTDRSDPTDTWGCGAYWGDPEIATRIVRGTVVNVLNGGGSLGVTWVADVS